MNNIVSAVDTCTTRVPLFSLNMNKNLLSQNQQQYQILNIPFLFFNDKTYNKNIRDGSGILNHESRLKKSEQKSEGIMNHIISQTVNHES